MIDNNDPIVRAIDRLIDAQRFPFEERVAARTHIHELFKAKDERIAELTTVQRGLADDNGALICRLEAENKALASKLHDAQVSAERNWKEKVELRYRLDHYEKALAEIIREGSDTYGIVSLPAQLADAALNAVLDNAALAARPQIVVEERVPTLMDQVRSAQRSMAEWPQWMKDAVTEARAADAEQHGTVWKQRAKSDPYCANCGLTWDMHLCDGRTSCPDRKRAPAVQGREPQCDHPVHSNPGLIVPCPSCGADTLDGVSNAQDVETHGPCGWDETDRGP